MSKKSFPRVVKMINTRFLVLAEKHFVKSYPFEVSKINVVSDIQVLQKSCELIEKLKLSTDSTFSF